MPYLKGLHLKIYGWKEGRDKDLYKTKIRLRVCLKAWGWEHENWWEKKELEALSLHKYEAAPEWLDPTPRFREEIVELKRHMAPDRPAVTRC